jgi:hypothetical protein
MPSRPKAMRAVPLPSAPTKMSLVSTSALPSQRPRAIAVVWRLASSGLV